MPNALNTLKNISFNVWLYCGVLILLVLWFVGYINRQPTESEIASRATRHYEEHYNKVQPNEKVPYIDSKLYGGIKRDGRYFAIPKEYAGGNGFAFLWPSKTPIRHPAPSEEKKLMGERNQYADKVQIEVYLESRYFAPYRATYRDLSKPESCYEPANNQMRWNKLIVWTRFDNSHQKDWSAICLEIVRILNQVKEVKL